MQNVISLSGGKDSTALLLMMLEYNEPIHSVVWFDTGWEFPEMYTHLGLLEKYVGFEFVRLKPLRPFYYTMIERPTKTREARLIKTKKRLPPNPNDYADKAEYQDELERWEVDPYEYKQVDKGVVHRIGSGWPSPKIRWCTREKTQAIDKYIRSIKSPVMQCIGFAADEAHRGTSANMKRNGFVYRYPLQEWGIDEKQALDYCLGKGFHWDGLYNVFSRVSCFCCPLQRMGELRKLRRHYPDLWAKMLKWDKEIPWNRGFKHWSTVHDLEARFAAEDCWLKFPGL